MQKLIKQGSFVLQSVTVKNFCRINSLEEDFHELSGENLFENLFDNPTFYPDRNAKCILLPVEDKDQIFEEYEEIFFNNSKINEVVKDKDRELNILNILPIALDLSLEEINFVGNFEKLDPNDCHCKKAHTFYDRIEKFWSKERKKKEVRSARKFKQKMLKLNFI